MLDKVVLKCEVPSIKDGSIIRLNIEQERVRQLASLGRKSALFELLYNVCGIVPPVNNIGYHEQNEAPFQDNWGGMRHAHVVFQGIKRPMNGQDFDKNVYVYIAKPKYVYRFEPHMVCVAKRHDAPAGAVFACYVLFDDEQHTSGKVVNWEWLEVDQQDPMLPADYSERYDKRVWANG